MKRAMLVCTLGVIAWVCAVSVRFGMVESRLRALEADDLRARLSLVRDGLQTEQEYATHLSERLRALEEASHAR